MDHTSGDRRMSRRRFLRNTSGSLAVLAVVPPQWLGGQRQTAPGDTLRLAGIGVGGVGFGQLGGCEKAGFAIVALCDVDDVYAKRAYDKWPQARRYRDFREMLDAESDRIDAVYIGTPDHTHAVATVAALGKGKHVCCVKPLTRTIHESRTVVAAAREAGVATQVTASPNSGEAGCRTCELIWAGAIGPVREVHVWSNRPLWPQGMARPDGQDQVPDTLDWDLWIGPAPERPFKADWPEDALPLKQVKPNRPRSAVYHPWNFRGWWDFGTGALGDMGCHHLNIPRRALKLGHPTSVHATSTKVLPESAPLASIVTWDFPAREDMPPVRVVWYDGGLKPPAPPEMADRPLPGEGTLYVGEEGKMLGPGILSEDRAKQFESTPKTLERRPGIWDEWAQACKGGQPASCSFDWAGPLAELVLVGNIAIRTGKKLDWDGEDMRFANDEEANQYLRESYREGWSL